VRRRCVRQEQGLCGRDAVGGATETRTATNPLPAGAPTPRDVRRKGPVASRQCAHGLRRPSSTDEFMAAPNAPQNPSPTFGARVPAIPISPFSREFEHPDRSALVEALRFTEVLRGVGEGGGFQGVFARLVESGRLDPRAPPCLGGPWSSSKGPICRYLSPLPDSNRGPPPYHFGVTATGGNPRQRFSPIDAFSASSIWYRLPPFATARLHERSIPRRWSRTASACCRLRR